MQTSRRRSSRLLNSPAETFSDSLGNFEEDILLVVIDLGEKAAHLTDIHAEAVRNKGPFARGATATSLNRLVGKGFLERSIRYHDRSCTSQRAMIFYKVTDNGLEALQANHNNEARRAIRREAGLCKALGHPAEGRLENCEP
jgi:hypothetical protein